MEMRPLMDCLHDVEVTKNDDKINREEKKHTVNQMPKSSVNEKENTAGLQMTATMSVAVM